MKYKIKAKVWLWNPEKGSWHFVTIEPKIANEISEKYKSLKGGWGSLPVKVYFKPHLASPKTGKGQNNKIILETVVFPNKQDKNIFTYILPIKKKIRNELGIQDGDIIEFELEIRK
jgi:hypothetical protein